jgi:ABC-type amino acid transport system permease subunit
MDTPRVMVDPDRSPLPPPPAFGSRAWRTLTALGIVLAAAGLTDISLAFYPPNLGSAPWRFTTFVSVMNGLPVLSLGLLVVLMAGLALGSRLVVQVGMAVNALVLVGLLIALVAIVTSAGATMAEVPEQVRVGIKKALVKGVAFGLIFGSAHLFAIFTGFKATRPPFD